MNKPRGRPFEPGNTFGRGRPKGSKNKLTEEAQQMFTEYTPALVRKCIAQALQGDASAMRLCMERILPAPRGGKVRFPGKSIQTVADVQSAMEQLWRLVASNQLTPEEHGELSRSLDRHREAIEKTELEQRIARLEQQQKPRKS